MSKKKLVALGATAAAVVVLVVLLVTQLTAKTTITVTDSIEISYSGCNGYATASISGNYAWREEALAELSDKADNNVELLNWQEALYSVSVTYDISPNENLSNGDTVTVTATITGDEALEDLPINLETKELEFTVADLEDVQVIDLFANVELTYEGYGPTAVPYVSDSCDYADVTVTYSCDKEYVDNGDTVVVTASYDAKALLAAGYQAEADTKEYTVSGLTSYISAIANIPDDDLAKMKSQAEDILAANVASNWSEDNEEFKSTEFLGCYLLTPKSTTSGYTGNYLYLVYKVKAWNASDGNLTYYTAFTYENVLTLADGTLSYDLDACSMSGNKYYPSGSWLGYYYYGYGSLESLFSAYVTANIDYWAYESTVSED